MAVLTEVALNLAALSPVAPAPVVLAEHALAVLVPMAKLLAEPVATSLDSALVVALVCCMGVSIAVIAVSLAGMACSAITNSTPTLEHRIKERRADHRPAPSLIRTTPPGGRAISSPPIPRASDRNNADARQIHRSPRGFLLGLFI
jgi:hypothetical protein